MADYNEAIRLDPTLSKAYNSRGFVWVTKKEYDKAIAEFNEAIRLDPLDAQVYCNRGIAWAYRKEYDKAIAEFNEAIRLDPKDAVAHNSLAWLSATCPDVKHRNGKRAVELATRACQLSEWKNASPLDTLAAANAEVGDFDKAVGWQEKANRLYTNTDDRKTGEDRLRLYQHKKPYRDEGK